MELLVEERDGRGVARAEAFQRKQREFREDLNQRKNEELATVQERATKVIKQVAEAEKYDLVVQEVVYTNAKHDITDKVLKILNGGK